MSEQQDKITLVCTTLGKNPELLDRMLKSAKGFDEIILHEDNDGAVTSLTSYDDEGSYIKKNLSIPHAYNLVIKNFVDTQWVCCMPDDDYFYPQGLSKMIGEVHKGINADVAHFRFHVSGYSPKQDLRRWISGKEYDLCEPYVTPQILEKHNRLPAGSFFRKSAWEKVGGFQGDKMHDWDLWKRMSNAGCRFKFFNYLVYNYVRRRDSAWIRQQKINQ